MYQNYEHHACFCKRTLNMVYVLAQKNTGNKVFLNLPQNQDLLEFHIF